ncbi:hypothetical protein ACVR05_03295 [Streptococcus caprae]|uniref:Uncharacterized protein n=1 Tax=Streptococcus caprae TaxID=1640501 RepID=A0ABV8CSN5_9STRE
MKTLRRLILAYPMQSFLLLYNTGVFAWLQTNGGNIAERLGLRSDWMDLILESIRILAGNSLTTVQGIIGQSGWTWFILSMVALLIFNFLKGVLKLILFCVIVGLGFYLVSQNLHLLNQIG